ncbi:hypothetical protein BDY19DRAFT_895518 [Irpex rosettiformis]|uniref:Uncharacterized protein n=1 Tax=Irpex rosettiformis TaxID=378272 RepID=A0ACB8TVQ0_9APHY|nr:hypothetical protein BDY19DRAFT_895518 [Irpex rosettiformis]
MSDLAETRSAIARVNTGKNANEDSWMTMWCNTNWGDLLQPAPLSIALLGSIMVIAASTDDFCSYGFTQFVQIPSALVSTDDAVPYKWEYARVPGSFKACLMQMVNEGYTAFGTAHKSMTRIQNASSQLPDVIKTAVYTIIKGNPDEVKVYLPDQIQSALDLANICASAAKESEDAFHGIQNLAGELVVACTNQVGTSEQKLSANKTQLAILEERKKSEEERVKVAKETNERMKKSFDNAETDFHDAVRNVPTGWDLVGMQVVESLTQLAVSAGNALVGAATLRQQAAMAGLGMLQHATGTDTDKKDGKNGGGASQPGGGTALPAQNTQPNAANISDPGVLEVTKVLQLTNALQMLVSGGPNGGPDWDKIRGKDADGSKSGGMYVQISLSTIKDRLDPSKPISSQLLPIMETAVTVAKGIMAVSKSAQGADDTALDKYKPQITTLITDTQQLVTKSNLILQQPGTVGSGPATPPTPAESSSSASKLAVENAKFQVDQTRANLEASRDAYNTATSKLLDQQEQISKTIAQLTSLSLTNAGIKAMLPVLKKAVGAFTTLQAQFSQISQFFDSVASLLADVLKPSVERWAKTMENTVTLGGVKIGDLARQLIYTQMMLPLKVSMLSEKIATVYLSVSDKYIMPAQRSVGGMMEFSDDTSEKGRAALKASLERKQQELQKQSNEASKQISALVAADQKKFVRAIDQRLDNIKTSLQNVLPAVAEPVPKQIQEVADDHVDQYNEKRDTAAKENPMFDEDDMM